MRSETKDFLKLVIFGVPAIAVIILPFYIAMHIADEYYSNGGAILGILFIVGIVSGMAFATERGWLD